MSYFNIQPILENEFVKIVPLNENDFEVLYKIASNPLIWEQHPNKDRYKREVFETFFNAAIESRGAFLLIDKKTENPFGSSRYYGLNERDSSVAIGYTFLSRDYWGGVYNQSIKNLMLNYAFQFVDKVFFYIGVDNIRSQKAIEKLGAIRTEQIISEDLGEFIKVSYTYRIDKATWNNK
jgi:RimJ/RimL family protein N-acetyltransferase